MFGQVGLTAPGLKSRLVFARAVCWPRIHLPHWLLDWTVESCLIGVAFGQISFSDLDFADDVSLLAELLELLVPILETMASEAASLGLEVNWQKTKVQALGYREDMPLTIKVQGQDVMVVEEFVYLGSLIHSSTGSTCDISC